jgi:hypothetical protein
VADLTPPARLTVDSWKSSPSVIGRNAGTVTVSVHITACGGRDASGALVYVTATPWDQFTVPSEAKTGTDGSATETMTRADHYPASPAGRPGRPSYGSGSILSAAVRIHVG